MLTARHPHTGVCREHFIESPPGYGGCPQAAAFFYVKRKKPRLKSGFALKRVVKSFTQCLLNHRAFTRQTVAGQGVLKGYTFSSLSSQANLILRARLSRI
jgi:hypothetical protein